MARPIILGNSRLTVGLNEKGFVHDFYYPYVGLENLTTSRSLHHKIGIWIDEQFSWLDEDDWDIEVKASNESLSSIISMKNANFGIELYFNDWVDVEKNAFCRLVYVKNLKNQARDVRLFFHQVFQISNEGRSDTALYVPEGHYLLDYKGRVCLLAYAQLENGPSFDQYAAGTYGIEGKQGTFRDAEDGELSNNAVEHGGVDSVMRVAFSLDANSEKTVEYWILANDSQFQLEADHAALRKDGLNKRLELCQNWWEEWLKPAHHELSKLKISESEKALINRSLMIIKAHCDHRGGIIASCDSSIYNYNRDYYSYVWPRDGAYAIWPLLRLGLFKEARKFFRFCKDIQQENGYLMHKYQADRSIGSTWHPLVHGNRRELAIQEDETAIVVFMLGEFLDYSHDEQFVKEMYLEFVVPAANFLARFVDTQTNLPHASYDLWEEKFLTHTYTTALTYRALMVASSLADRFDDSDTNEEWRNAASKMLEAEPMFFDPDTNALRKGYLLDHDGNVKFDNTLDVSSLYGSFMYEFGTDKSHIASTARAIEERLKDNSPSGGVPRYEFDNYFAEPNKHKGNPWFVTTCWLAQYYVRVGKKQEAEKLLSWILNHLSSANTLPEQIGADSSKRVGVEPLVWSHAELINTLLDLRTD